LYLIDHVGKALRPSGALRGVALLGSRVIDSSYPHTLNGPHDGKKLDATPLPGAQPAKIVLSLSDGVVLAFDPKGLLSLAQEVDCTIEMVPQVGDHVSVGDPLFRIYGGSRDSSAEVLQHSVAKGQERTLEQDPTFALRIIVDVASKALSPAINDPTTAVLALDQIHKLLRKVGNRNLDIGHVRDSAGQLRLVYHTPDWEDFVYLAVTEIRHFGGASIQIVRRLRAMLENLILTLPDARSTLLRQELTMLQRSSERLFAEPEDRALAGISDFQGVGGNRE
jgi:uncharacterized membrane protein